MSFVNIGTVGKRIHPSNYSLYLQKLNIKPQITINPFILQISLSKVSLSWELTKKKCPSQIFVDRMHSFAEGGTVHELILKGCPLERVMGEYRTTTESNSWHGASFLVYEVSHCWGLEFCLDYVLFYFCENSFRQEPMTSHCLLLSHTSPPNSESFFLYSIFLSVSIQHFEVFKASSLHKLSLNQ